MPYDNVPPRETYTFPNGAVATIRRVSQFTIGMIGAEAQKKIPAVPVPMSANSVDMGDGPKFIQNPGDPAYKEAVAARSRQINTIIMDGMIDLGIEIEVDQAELDRVKETMARLGITLNEISDKVAYIKHCCVQDLARDFAPLAEKIRGVTEEAIQEQEESFSDHTARQTPGPDRAADVGPAVQPDTGDDSRLSLAGHLG